MRHAPPEHRCSVLCPLRQVDEQHASFREGLLRHYHKQSSAVNLSRLSNPAELRRLQDDLRQALGAL